MTTIIGLDPGVHTGVATFRNGNLIQLATISPHRGLHHSGKASARDL